MTRLARAFWVTRPFEGEIRESVLGAPASGEVMVEALYSSVSRGTEALVFQGKVPETEYDRMRCPHQEGDFPGPLKYGYASVGRVVEGPSALSDRTVFCLYPHQSAYVVPISSVVPLPPSVTSSRAVLAANLETALNALWDARPLAGDRISVVGAGVLGCLFAYLARKIPAAEVELVDVRPERAKVAEALGVSFATPDEARKERDLVVHASASAEGLRTALDLASSDVTVLELSWFGDRAVALPLGGAFHVKRLALRSSQVGTVSPNARGRFTHRARLELALSFCADEALDVLFTSESSLSDLPATMRELCGASGGALCHRVRYDS
jgi:NADPH:quinone reductase-like Zn-dependent oxidoreductase